MTPTPTQLEARHRRPAPGADQHLVNCHIGGLDNPGPTTCPRLSSRTCPTTGPPASARCGTSARGRSQAASRVAAPAEREYVPNYLTCDIVTLSDRGRSDGGSPHRSAF